MPHHPVTAVTDRPFHIGDTSVVNMVQRASKYVLLEPGDTRRQWKGEAAASFVYVQGSPVAACYRPPAPATGPRLYLVLENIASAPEAKHSFGGDFLPASDSTNHLRHRS